MPQTALIAQTAQANTQLSIYPAPLNQQKKKAVLRTAFFALVIYTPKTNDEPLQSMQDRKQ